jgi:hypothetical protein
MLGVLYRHMLVNRQLGCYTAQLYGSERDADHDSDEDCADRELHRAG